VRCAAQRTKQTNTNPSHKKNKVVWTKPYTFVIWKNPCHFQEKKINENMNKRGEKKSIWAVSGKIFSLWIKIASLMPNKNLDAKLHESSCITVLHDSDTPKCLIWGSINPSLGIHSLLCFEWGKIMVITPYLEDMALDSSRYFSFRAGLEVWN
jgi:hypothetical protein